MTLRAHSPVRQATNITRKISLGMSLVDKMSMKRQKRKLNVFDVNNPVIIAISARIVKITRVFRRITYENNPMRSVRCFGAASSRKMTIISIVDAVFI